MRSRMMGAGVYDHGYILGYERLNDHLAEEEVHDIVCGEYALNR